MHTEIVTKFLSTLPEDDTSLPHRRVASADHRIRRG